MIFSQCVTSLIANINILTRAGINVRYEPILMEAYVCRAKNRALKMLEDNTKYDAIMIVDYDLGFDEYAISKLIVAEKDFIGGAYPFKSSQGYPVGYYRDAKTNEIIKDDRGVLLASFVPGGFTLITRKVIDELNANFNIKTSSGMKFYYDEGFVIEDEPDQWFGEDKVLNKRLLKCGITMWIEPRIEFTHVGISGNEGTYNDYLENKLNSIIQRIH